METPDTFFLYPSTVFASDKPVLVSTLLGSCVSVCLYDPVKRIGGMNHYMLPVWKGEGLESPKFGDVAIGYLIKRMERLGSKNFNIRATIFGGADVIEQSENQFRIGRRNIELARKKLQEQNIEIISSNVGGAMARRVLFNTYTGDIELKFIKKGQGYPIIVR